MYMDVTDHSLSVLSPFVSTHLLSTNKTPHCKELIFPAKLFSLACLWLGGVHRNSSLLPQI